MTTTANELQGICLKLRKVLYSLVCVCVCVCVCVRACVRACVHVLFSDKNSSQLTAPTWRRGLLRATL